jgi:glycosyltransferase involved in cell wall biosynthesis
MDKQVKIRVLQTVGAMGMGGIETWLMHILRNFDRDKYQIDFLVETEKKYSYDEEILDLGSKIIPYLDYKKPWSFAKNFSRILKQNPPYDVIHSHVGYYSGYVMRLAASHKIPIRISHCHNNLSIKEGDQNISRKLYSHTMKYLVKKHSTNGLAASERAAVSLFGHEWHKDPRWQVSPCGLDFMPFNQEFDHRAIRKEFGIPSDAIVVGHVGRFSEQKNHAFLLDVFAQILQQYPQAWLLLVGEGSLKPLMEEKSRQLHISHRVTFAGQRNDVPRIMKGAMDVFLFPSKWEGLGLVLVEAQAAGIPCVISDRIPYEADVIPELISRLKLDHPIKAWCDSVLASTQKQQICHKIAFNKVLESNLSIQHSVDTLVKLYNPRKTTA